MKIEWHLLNEGGFTSAERMFTSMGQLQGVQGASVSLKTKGPWYHTLRLAEPESSKRWKRTKLELKDSRLMPRNEKKHKLKKGQSQRSFRPESRTLL